MGWRAAAGGAGGPRGPAHEGAPGARRPAGAPACHVTGLDMARQTLRVPRGRARLAAPGVTHRAVFEFGGDKWDAHRAQAPHAALPAREHGVQQQRRAEFDADDDDLCLTVRRCPSRRAGRRELRLRLSCASPSSGRRAFAVLKKGLRAVRRQVAGLAASLPATGRRSDKAARTPWDSPVRLPHTRGSPRVGPLLVRASRRHAVRCLVRRVLVGCWLASYAGSPQPSRPPGPPVWPNRAKCLCAAG